MENKSHALIAGLFIIALSTALVLAALWFDRDTRQRLPYELVTRASVSGLTVQSSVRYRGLYVGKVQRIRFDPEVPGQILVDIAVETGTPITRSTFATLGYQGVTGLAYVQFDDDGSSSELLQTSAGKPARIAIRPGLFDKLAGNGEGLMIQLDQIARRLNQLLAPENQQRLMRMLDSMDVTINSFGRIGPKLEPTLDRLPQVVGEAQQTLSSINGMAQDFSATAQSVGRLSTRIQGTGGTLDHLDQGIRRLDALSLSLTGATETFSADTLPRLNQMADDGARSARALNRAVENLADHPQSLLFGEEPIPPGPGEPGFSLQSGE